MSARWTWILLVVPLLTGARLQVSPAIASYVVDPWTRLQGSPNVNIRNGVGILPGNKLLFAISREPVNFYDFAAFFKAQGCRYAPEQQWEQTDGDFGVIIASSVSE
ncbi:hypothetical protein [Dinghuibacter silviterrae]|uniref:hypothetical protein n=1 Tax=Dinghuibacter silviterrae TaxID=1539049 RepID=UPI001062584B|nr:hypothetical protein [Dinghuibacter silviterrae]